MRVTHKNTIMTKYKVGDKFVPRKPNHYNIANLKNYWNCTYTVRAINNEWVIARENGLMFHVDWCEKVEHISDGNQEITNRAQPTKPRFPTDRIEKGQKPYTPNWYEEEERIPAVGKTIDWEQRRYEIAKKCLAAQINGVYAGNLEWSYEREVKSAIEAADELIEQLQKPTEN